MFNKDTMKYLLSLYVPYIAKEFNAEGWFVHHSTNTDYQQMSINAIRVFNAIGFNFDLVLLDGKTLSDVDLSESKILLTYNTSNNAAKPSNGVYHWRIVRARAGTESAKVVQALTIPIYEINVADVKCPIDPELIRQITCKVPLTQEELYTQMFEPERVPHYANDKYKREIKPGVFIDVYDIIKCYEVTSGPLQHALKKVLAAGQRGHKDLEQDLIDILSSTERALFQLQEEKNK